MRAPAADEAGRREPGGDAGGALAYLTDVEGSWERLATFAEGNPYVRLDADGSLDVAPGACFVFGGDAIDRGPDARRIVAALVAVKRRIPERVVLIAGNRDINKLRLARELGGHPPRKAPPEAAGWPRAALLKWILEKTMGARFAFEFRREELARERSAGPSSASSTVEDDEVARSFVADLGPGGALREYLSLCRLGWRSGATLFVHGAVTAESLGVVPCGSAGAAVRFEGVDAWLAGLNRWYGEQVEAYVGGRQDSNGEPGWAGLVAYQAPVPGTERNQASVVYGRLTDDQGKPHLPPPRVVDALRADGVRRLLVGHTPNGDSPSPLRAGGFELVVADTSYSRLPNGAQVLIEGERLRVRGQAQLDDGSRHEVRIDVALADADSPIGRRDAATGQLVKGVLGTGDYVLFRYHGDHQVEQVAVSPSALRGRRLVAPEAGE
ncbi:MAG: hypothetical protein HYZ53_22940 [Planctomycetes bacterium]|nr:hypothetical protein [Planctomycetota bacterium]